MTTLLDSTIRRDAQLLCFGTYLKSEYITPAMQSLAVDIPRSLVGYDELNKREKNKLVAEISALMKSRLDDMFTSITNELHEMTAQEIEFTSELYDDFIESELKPVVVAASIKAADSAIISLEKGLGRDVGVWSEFAGRNTDSATREVVNIVRDGFDKGRTLSDMTQQIRGKYNRAAKKYMGGILDTTTARAESLVRTGVSHYSNRARDSFAQANKSILDYRVFFATLDNRTTTQCLHFHLSKYELDDSAAPTLPLHYGERSVYLLGGEGLDPLSGSRPVIGGQSGKQAIEAFEARQSRTDKKVKYRGRKDSNVFDVEQVSAKVTSQQFMERQPRFFVESALGKTRAKLFLDGKLPIKKFTDLQGRPLTLDELKKTAEGEKAFRRIGE